MNATALNEGALAKELSHRFAQRFGSIDHHQQRTLGIESPFDQIFQQRFDHGRVFARAVPQAKDLFHSGRIDSQGHYHAILPQMFAIDDERDQIRGHGP